MRKLIDGTVRTLAWVVSAALSVRLFTSLSTDLLSALLLAGLALSLEGGKLRAVREARATRRPAAAALAGVLVLISLVASAGSALVLVEERREVRAEARKATGAAEEERALRLAKVEGIDRQIGALAGILERTPVEWAGTSKSLRAEIAALRAERLQAEIALGRGEGRNPGISAQADMFALLTETSGLPEGIFLLGFLLAVSAALEALILLEPEELANKGRNGTAREPVRESRRRKCLDAKAPLAVLQFPPRRKPRVETTKSELTPRRKCAQAEMPKRLGRPPKELDAEALVPDFSRLLLERRNALGFAERSRDEAAAAMGLSSWQGKTLYRLAVERGYLETRGRRTKAGPRSA